MSKKKNKKSVKKKSSKKPAPKKKIVKKSSKKVVKPKKKVAPKKIKSKKAVKKVKKAPVKKKTAKKAVKKAAAKKILKKVPAKKPVAKGVSKPLVATKPVVIEKPPVVKEPKAPKPAKVVKPVIVQLPKKSVVIDIKMGPEPAGKFELEYVVHASSQILFEFLTTPSGLSEWFCDDVNIRNGIYSFKWEENEQNARVVKLVEEKVVRFQWIDKHDNSYFEFRIERDDLTNDISLIIVDFAETPEERASSSLLWTSQIDKLLHVLGAYF